MALPAAFLEELRARTPLPAVIGRRVKLAKSGRHWKGCCPFHGEKTPSFYVYDDHYHCFGCGVHGDAISFVMQITGAGFPETVQQMAAEAGLEVPQDSPEAAARERRRHDLHSVLDAAMQAFQARLFAAEGRVALEYLRGRGLTDQTIRGFGLGWSGEGRDALAELQRDGVTPALLAETGLTRVAENGAARPLFFNRVMFPIRDRRGRVISFGGRIMGDGQPKYVNGPETPLFSKRRTLYALDAARGPAREGQAVLAVEGYMDVIALHQAGFRAAVAPLGTALTAEQMEELWRLSPRPVLCFDGDGAGSRAALRAMDVALPLLTPDRSLAIAVLPPGEDPDSLLKSGKPAAFQAVLDGARPLAQAMFGALREGVADTPEARAGFRNRLVETAARIPDKSLASEYRGAWLDLFFQTRPGSGRGQGRGQRQNPAKGTFGGASGGGASPRAAPPVRPVPDAAAALHQRLRLLTVILLRHPDLMAELHDAYCRLDLPSELDRLRHAMLDWSEHAPLSESGMLDSADLIDHLRSMGLGSAVDGLLAAVTGSLPACGRADAMPAEARKGWWHFFELVRPDGLDHEIRVVQQSLAAWDRPEEAQQRMVALCAIRDALRRGEYGLEDER